MENDIIWDKVYKIIIIILWNVQIMKANCVFKLVYQCKGVKNAKTISNNSNAIKSSKLKKV